jgi:FkbM family methyltransferase
MGLIDRYRMEFKQQLALSYIDIGAWRPVRGSNTFFLYKEGAHGTVVEPNPHLKMIWRATRPRDSYLPVGCGNQKFADLQIFHPSAASNTFSESFSHEITESQGYEVSQTLSIPLMTLQEIIESHLRETTQPFLLDIDVEGMDFEVLSSFDFPKGLRPIIILIEDMPSQIDMILNPRIDNYLTKHGYKLVARTIVTAIYFDQLLEIHL